MISPGRSSLPLWGEPKTGAAAPAVAPFVLNERRATRLPQAPQARRQALARSRVLARGPHVPRAESGGGGGCSSPLRGSHRLPQPLNDTDRNLTNGDEARACQGPAASLNAVSDIPSFHREHDAMEGQEVSDTKRSSQVATRRDAVERAISRAIADEATAASIKDTARDAEVSQQRVKQMRAEPTEPKASTLILLAQRRPELRSLLMELLWSEAGDGDRSPAQILDAIARMIR